MLEYTSVDNPRKRVTIIPDFITSLVETGKDSNQTTIEMSNGKVWIVDAPYETVRIHVGQALGCDLEDEEFEDNDFLNDCNEIG